jgi:hypothetical protein
MSNDRTCPSSGVFIVHVYQVSVASHSLPSILDGNGVTCLCFISFMVFATMPLTPDCNVLWSFAVHPLRMMYWSTMIHRSRTSSSDLSHYSVGRRTPHQTQSPSPLLTPSFLSAVLCFLSVLRPELLLSISVPGGVWACRCPSPAHTIFSCTAYAPARQFSQPFSSTPPSPGFPLDHPLALRFVASVLSLLVLLWLSLRGILALCAFAGPKR